MGFSTQSAEQTVFVDGQGNKQSLVEYFQSRYNYSIKFPRLPCVLVGGDTKIPPECCVIMPGTPLPPLSLNANQVQDMISQSAQKPHDRVRRIEEIRESLAYEKSDRVAAWGVDVAARPVQVRGRVLPPPTVMYAQNRTIRTANGGWNLANVRVSVIRII